MMKPSVTRSLIPETLRLVRCSVNDNEYCLDMSAIHNVGRPQQLGWQAATANDNGPAGTIGWITVRQNQFPVFDLSQCLHLTPSTTSADVQPGFVMLVNAAQPFGVRVDEIVGHLEVAASQMAALPHIVEPGANKLFRGIVKRDKEWLLCADAHQLQPTAPASTFLPPPFESVRNVTNNASSASSTAAATSSQRGQVMLFSSAQTSVASADVPPIVLGLSLKQVQEIAPLPPILPVPGAPNYVFGITNWRGTPLPVIDPETRLGLKNEPVSAQVIAPQSRLLIARAPHDNGDHNGLLGFPIKPQVKAFPLPIPYQRRRHRLSLDTDLLLGIFDLEDSPLLIPDVAAMLTRNFIPRAQPIG